MTGITALAVIYHIVGAFALIIGVVSLWGTAVLFMAKGVQQKLNPYDVSFGEISPKLCVGVTALAIIATIIAKCIQTKRGRTS